MIQKIKLNAVVNQNGDYEYRYSQTKPFIVIDYSSEGFDTNFNLTIDRLIIKRICLRDIINSNLTTNTLVIKSNFLDTGNLVEQIYIIIYHE